MFHGIIELLFHPDVFFSRKQHEEIRLVIPAIIVGIGGMVSFITPLTQRAIIDGGDLSNFIMEPSAADFFSGSPVYFMVPGCRNSLRFQPVLFRNRIISRNAAELRVWISPADNTLPDCDHQWYCPCREYWHYIHAPY